MIDQNLIEQVIQRGRKATHVPMIQAYRFHDGKMKFFIGQTELQPTAFSEDFDKDSHTITLTLPVDSFNFHKVEKQG